MTEVSYSTRRWVRPDQTAVPLQLYVAGVPTGSPTLLNLTTSATTRDSIVTVDSREGLWPSYRRLKRSRHWDPKSATARVLDRCDLGNPYYRDILEVASFPKRDKVISASPQSAGATGQAVVSQPFVQLTNARNQWPSALTSTMLSKTNQENLLLSRGAQVVANTLPQQPHADLVPALIECLREGLPRLGDLRPGSMSPREFASSFLTWEFGVKPLAADIQATLRAVRNSQALLAEYARRYENTYRRAYHYPLQRTTATGRTNLQYVIYPHTYLYNCANTAVGWTGVADTECRFAGEYLYHQYVSGEMLDQLSDWAGKADHLLGLDPSRLVHIWDSLPWTWLIDWLANVGDVLRCYSYLGRDGLVMRYGYLTLNQTITVSYYGGALKSWCSDTSPFSFVIRQNRKMRVKATPFGFGLNPTAFTNKQWAILASLGITRGGPRL